MFQTIYQSGPNGLWVFLLLTVVAGGVTAYVTGKAIAETWRPYWQVLLYSLMLACVVRFLHFALFEEVLLSLQNLIVDFLVLLIAAFVGHALARKRQMATQYGWPK